MSSQARGNWARRKICVVYGHGGEQVRAALDAPDLAWALQEPQLGTGHAVMQALPQLAAVPYRRRRLLPWCCMATYP
jgi:bifunctional N-acetylglucosamine-1-phosphate-uridyltransferase/glucosamine-1-phosphate-acetyltransferase GlmU-like protein